MKPSILLVLLLGVVGQIDSHNLNKHAKQRHHGIHRMLRGSATKGPKAGGVAVGALHSRTSKKLGTLAKKMKQMVMEAKSEASHDLVKLYHESEVELKHNEGEAEAALKKAEETTEKLVQNIQKESANKAKKAATKNAKKAFAKEVKEIDRRLREGTAKMVGEIHHEAKVAKSKVGRAFREKPADAQHSASVVEHKAHVEVKQNTRAEAKQNTSMEVKQSTSQAEQKAKHDLRNAEHSAEAELKKAEHQAEAALKKAEGDAEKQVQHEADKYVNVIDRKTRRKGKKEHLNKAVAKRKAGVKVKQHTSAETKENTSMEI